MIDAFNIHPVFISTAIVCSFWTAWYLPSLRDINYWHDVPFQRTVHQYVMNLSGYFIGWFALYYLLFERAPNLISLEDLAIMFIAYVGITGYLPHLIVHKGLKP